MEIRKEYHPSRMIVSWLLELIDDTEKYFELIIIWWCSSLEGLITQILKEKVFNDYSWELKDYLIEKINYSSFKDYHKLINTLFSNKIEELKNNSKISQSFSIRNKITHWWYNSVCTIYKDDITTEKFNLQEINESVLIDKQEYIIKFFNNISDLIKELEKIDFPDFCYHSIRYYSNAINEIKEKLKKNNT